MNSVSLAALGIAIVAATAAKAEDGVTVIDGHAGGGYIVRDTDSSTFYGIDVQKSGTVITDTIFTNFVTQGGAGSGGGAGLGGVFFVDSNTNLTLNNVQFTTNTVIGGTGGSAPGVSAGVVSLALAGNQTSVIGVGGMVTDPGLTLTGGVVTVNKVTLSAANSLLKVGMKVSIPGITGEGELVEITGVNGKEVSFAPVTVDPTSLSASLIQGSLGSDQIRFDAGDLTGSDAPTVGSYIVGAGIAAGTTVKSIDTTTGIVTLSKPLDSTAQANAGFEFVAVGALSASPLVGISTSGGQTTFTMLDKAPGQLVAGMEITGDGIPEGAKIVSVSVDGKTVVIDKEVPSDTAVTGFNAATIAASVGSSTVVLPRANETLKAGMTVSGTGIPQGTKISSVNTVTDPNTGLKTTTVVLSNAIEDEVPNSLSFSGIDSISGATISFVAGTMPANIAEGMAVTGPGIPEGTTVASVDGNSVTLSVDVTDPDAVANIRFADPLQVGGSMNGMVSTGTGVSGQTGSDNDVIYAIVNGGEGGDGNQGQNGFDANASGQVGGNGGNGGNGSSALPFQPDLTLAVTLGAIEAAIGTSQVGADLVPKGAPIPVPDPAKAAVDAAALTETYTQLAKDAATLALWNVALAAGRVAKGGDGGDGGDGGNGSTFFGGGAGGEGGEGGDGGISVSTGGSGGAGGAGGNGGFGAGGGGGGAGGEAGDGMYAPVGSPGLGGLAGFGGGIGSDGDGLFGGGGSGFGGAIFVRNGGALTITGNTSFSDNETLGGSSLNGGKAGASAGSDLFVMKGATVILQPGAGNTITFNGGIADDSRASYAEAPNGQGQGADITIAGPGLVVFNGTNTYSGQTIIQGGMLDADEGVGIHRASNINFNGSGRTGSLNDSNSGVLMTSGQFTRQTGTIGNRVQFTGSGGFAAYGGDLTINIGGANTPKTLAWGKDGFFSNTTDAPDAISGSLILGSSMATGKTVLLNNIDLQGGTRQIVAVDNAEVDTDWSVITGVISNGKLIVGENSGYGAGTLILQGQNTYTGGTEVRSGTLATTGGGTFADTGDILVGEYGKLILATNDTIRDLTNSGEVYVSAEITAEDLVNSGTLTLANGKFTLTGSLSNTGSIHVTGEETTLTADALSGDGDIVVAKTGGGASTLKLVQSDESEFSGTISGTGGVDLSGGGKLTLSGENTYSGATKIATGSTLALSGDGSIEESSGVEADGTFDIAATTDGATVNALTGTGNVTLGSKTLSIADAAGTFSGVIGGSGGVTIEGGEQTLSGVNTYTGATTVDDGAKLKLTGAGSIATSSSLDLEGVFDIAGKTGDASLISLTGGGDVTLGSNSLNLTEATGQFDGVIAGTGGVNVKGGIATFTGTNTYTGATTIDTGAFLILTEGGSIAESSGVTANGMFGIADTTNGASIKDLSGSGSVEVGEKTLTVTAAASTFAGAIGGTTGGLDLTGGELTLSGVNTYAGTTLVAEDAKLSLTGTGGIANSSMSLDGTFDISGTSAGAALKALTGAGIVDLGTQSLTISAATGTFTGKINGTGGDFIVGGGQMALTDAIVAAGIVAKDGGQIDVSGGSVTAGGSKSALSIINGGKITTEDVTLTSGGATASASFDEAGKTAEFYLGDGTVLADSGVLLHVTRTGVGSDGVVKLNIDTNGIVTGDIIDQDAKTNGGGTDVTIADGSSWTGLADTASFLIETGGSAVFKDGSKIDGSLVAQAGAVVFGSTLGSGLEITGDATIENGAITGNVNIIGDLNLNGLLSPGASPGVVNVSGSLNNGGYADSLFEITFGSNNPLPGLNNQYDQINIGANVDATLPVRLAAWQPGMSPGDAADRSIALGNLDAIELIKVGGTENTGFEQVGRLTQNGHEVFLVRTTRDADASLQVANAGKNEEEFFGAGPITVYGVDAFEQDETFGLATAANTIHMADRDMIGSYLERRGARLEAGQSSTWMRMGASHADIVDGITWSQDVAFGQVGIDLLTDNSFHAGVFGTFGNVNSQITTNTGVNPMVGQMYAAGVEASWTAGGAYLDAAGQVGWSQFTFTPTAASDMSFTGVTTTASIEAGYAIDLDVVTVTPWTQVVWQSTAFGDVETDWVDNVEFTDPNSATVRGGIRLAAGGDGFSVYGNAGVAYDAYDQKSVVVDGFEMGSGTGGTKAELGAGIEAKVADGVIITTAIKGSYGIETGDVIGYQGSAGIRGNW